MSENNVLGFGGSVPLKAALTTTEHVIIQRPLQRVLAFTGRTIDDVINNPIARSEVFGYYKLSCWIARESEVSDLERQWNPLSIH